MVAAEAFCNGTDIKALKCNWAGETEQSLTASGAFAGTLWQPEPNPPKELSGNPNYFQIASKVVSLACKSRLTVRTVFKLLPGSQGCTRLLLDSSTLGSYGRAATTITRCQLRFPPLSTDNNGTDAAAIESALAAPDTACQTCNRCEGVGACPSAINVWFSDTASFTSDGCAQGVAARPNDPYTPTKPGIVVNPGNSILLAGFTVKQA